MATAKDYAALVKKINNASESERGDLAKQKQIVAQELQNKAAKSGRKAKRELKFTMDEINNS